MRSNRAGALFLGAVLTLFAGMLIAGHGPWAGDVLLRLTANHGINVGDTLVIGLWLASMAVLWRIGASED